MACEPVCTPSFKVTEQEVPVLKVQLRRKAGLPRGKIPTPIDLVDAFVCPCHRLPHTYCPWAEPCLGGCGRLTTGHESTAPGYCLMCGVGSADRAEVEESKWVRR